jgi:hypothetical protein
MHDAQLLARQVYRLSLRHRSLNQMNRLQPVIMNHEHAETYHFSVNARSACAFQHLHEIET